MQAMYANTLPGIFPEPKPPLKRNFVKENVKQIKRMQGLLRDMSPKSQGRLSKDKYQTMPVKVPGQYPLQLKSKVKANNDSTDSIPLKKASERSIRKSKKQRTQKINTEIRLAEDNVKSQETSGISTLKRHDKFVTRGIQTERMDNVEKIFETGVIKYPSDSIKSLSKKGSPRVRQERKMESGDAPLNSPPITALFESKDTTDSLTDKITNLNINERQHDFIKENIMALKQKASKQEGRPNPHEPPPGYQRGQLPKYLKDRKEEQMKEIEEKDLDCPEGHVLLPDEERKETLRVLRQSYADRIQELNSMPVRSDTLRMKKRKMEIEEELNKIDEGIKVFQRPKVYVKVNA